jgi:hypothetical protein
MCIFPIRLEASERKDSIFSFLCLLHPIEYLIPQITERTPITTCNQISKFLVLALNLMLRALALGVIREEFLSVNNYKFVRKLQAVY